MTENPLSFCRHICSGPIEIATLKNTYNAPKPDFSELTQTEALEILGLDQDATENEVLKAHRRLIQRLHPDRGGSDYLAAKINAAKDKLTAS